MSLLQNQINPDKVFSLPYCKNFKVPKTTVRKILHRQLNAQDVKSCRCFWLSVCCGKTQSKVRGIVLVHTVLVNVKLQHSSVNLAYSGHALSYTSTKVMQLKQRKQIFQCLFGQDGCILGKVFFSLFRDWQ